VTWAEFQIPANPRFVLNSFAMICLVWWTGMASVMGDEIQERRKLYRDRGVGRAFVRRFVRRRDVTLLIAVSKSQISVLQGIVQASGAIHGVYVRASIGSWRHSRFCLV